ncbi:MAG TPA: 50S ribosomal protein L18 [Candidatus Dojkabacteria bacterium]|jgi:large subunit ribosomal protein L18
MEKRINREKRKLRIRKRLNGTAERPRLSVFRSNSNVYAQLIDDERMVTICEANSLKIKGKGIKVSEKVGEAIAKKAISAKVTKAVFDRRGNKYHGNIKALADAARKGGLDF